MHAVATPIVLSDPCPCSRQYQEKTPLNSLIHQTTSVLELLTQGATRGPRTGAQVVSEATVGLHATYYHEPFHL